MKIKQNVISQSLIKIIRNIIYLFKFKQYKFKYLFEEEKSFLLYNIHIFNLFK